MSLTEYFLASRSDIVPLELLKITHPNFIQDHRIVRNAIAGVTVASEFYTYYPCQIKSLAVTNALEFGISVTLGDLSQVVPPEIDALFAADNLDVHPTVVHSIYRHDDLVTPLYSATLELDDYRYSKENSFFTAKAASLNVSKTGELYTLDRFPMLKGFL